MSVVNELINAQGESLEFGNYELGAKTKKDGFEFQGDIYRIPMTLQDKDFQRDHKA